MAGPTFCVNCALLPIKDREVATRIRRCPECKAEVGVTSYGKPFRARAAKRGGLLTPSIFVSVCAGAATLTAFAACLVYFMLWRIEPDRPRAKPMAAVKPIVFVNPPMVEPIPEDELVALVPEPLIDVPGIQRLPPVPPELLEIPEVALEDPFPRHINQQKAMQEQRDLIGQVRRENAAKRDGFLLAHMDRRTELRGLPFIMGDDCKLGVERGTDLARSVREIRRNLDQGMNGPHAMFGLDRDSKLAAMSQILATEHVGVREDFAVCLTDSKNSRAGVILANSALSDRSENIRKTAIAALRIRGKQEEYTEVLLRGLRYPLPSVAKNAADAIIALDRKDLLPQLVDFLGEAGPNDPIAKKIGGKEVHVMREVVRINHHRNCLLCHAPVATAHESEVAALMPTPGRAFPTSSQQYYGSRITPESLAVRADITYLRQDFSVLMPVADAHPWPEMQRFDFLVRTRVVEGDELAKMQKAMERPAAYLSEQHKEALRVLRQLSGQDAAQTQGEWRRVLGLKS